MNQTRGRPIWSIDCRKAMIDKDISVKELAAEIGRSRELVSSVLSGRINSPVVRNLICDFLNVNYCEN